LGRRVAPDGRGLDQDERRVVVEWRAGVAEQIVTHAWQQVGADTIGAGRGELTEAGGQGIAPVARVAGLGHTVGVKKQRAARWKWQRPPSGAAIA